MDISTLGGDDEVTLFFLNLVDTMKCELSSGNIEVRSVGRYFEVWYFCEYDENE